ncbi:uncharacterized protein LOC135348769 isoform X2 [Halichondria panicea]|uniref:uncharacterized protein LOC135348769 isoform X2 n=1 Tax=Halichondria panicea TaxID=6063 RepID=UPI00312B8186
MAQLSLNDRVFVARRTFTLSPPRSSYIPTVAKRPTSYKSWTESTLYKAYLAHIEDGLSVRDAAEAYGVPKSTLQDRVSGRVKFGARSGPPKLLTDEEENELVSFLCGCASMGYAKSKQEVLALVRNIVQTKGLRTAVVTDGWWTSFKKRHGELAVRAAEPLSYSRAVASSPQVISCYYDLLEQTLTENDLLDCPSQIYNMDETGMPLDPAPPKIITVRGVKHPIKISTGNKAQLTCVSAVSATGQIIPPMIIFDRMNIKTAWTYGEVPGTRYGTSKNGWIDSVLFEDWFKCQFLPNASPVRPVLLIMDGHSTHYQPSTVRLAASEQVILFCLPPNTTHLTQPLDKGCFGPLKRAWRKECHSYMAQSGGKMVTRYEFSRLFNKAWFASMTPANAISGFRCTGIVPFNREAIRLPVADFKDRVSSLAQETGLNFIPLYNCSPSRSIHLHDASVEETDSSDGDSPAKSPAKNSCVLRQTAVTKCLSAVTVPELHTQQAKPVGSGRVLTSSENLKIINQKEQMKLEKELKKKQAQQKRLQKQEAKKQKQKQTLTPARLPKESTNSVPESDVVFTDNEWDRFETRLLEGYDLAPKGRYKLWLEMYHPQAGGTCNKQTDERESDLEVSPQPDADDSEGRRSFGPDDYCDPIVDALFDSWCYSGDESIGPDRETESVPDTTGSCLPRAGSQEVTPPVPGNSQDPLSVKSCKYTLRSSRKTVSQKVSPPGPVNSTESVSNKKLPPLGRPRKTEPVSAAAKKNGSLISQGPDSKKRPVRCPRKTVSRKVTLPVTATVNSQGAENTGSQEVEEPVSATAKKNGRLISQGPDSKKGPVGRPKKTVSRKVTPPVTVTGNSQGAENSGSRSQEVKEPVSVTHCSTAGHATRTVLRRVSPLCPMNTRESVAINKHNVGRPRKTISQKVTKTGVVSSQGLCISRRCTNADSGDWVKCDNCGQWYHCECVGIVIENAKEIRFECC